MPSENTRTKEYLVKFKELPAEAQKIIGAREDTGAGKRLKDGTLMQIRNSREWNERYGKQQIPVGADARRLELEQKELRRSRRVFEVLEREGNFRKIAQTHPLVSVEPNGDIVFRQATVLEAARRARQGFRFGSFILAERPGEKRIAIIRAVNAERVSVNRALAAELKRRGAKIDQQILADEFGKNRGKLGLTGWRPEATRQELIARIPETADQLIKKQRILGPRLARQRANRVARAQGIAVRRQAQPTLGRKKPSLAKRAWAAIKRTRLR